MKEIILNIIYSSIDEINLDLDEKVEKNEAEELFTTNSKLDSMGLVSLIVTVEEKIQQHFGVDITLADDKAMSQTRSPFRTIESLTHYIEGLLNKD